MHALRLLYQMRLFAVESVSNLAQGFTASIIQIRRGRKSQVPLPAEDPSVRLSNCPVQRLVRYDDVAHVSTPLNQRLFFRACGVLCGCQVGTMPMARNALHGALRADASRWVWLRQDPLPPPARNRIGTTSMTSRTHEMLQALPEKGTVTSNRSEAALLPLITKRCQTHAVLGKTSRDVTPVSKETETP